MSPAAERLTSLERILARLATQAGARQLEDCRITATGADIALMQRHVAALQSLLPNDQQPPTND